MKICVFGNSHLGALKIAANAAGSETRTPADFLFWGAAGKNFPEIKLVNGKLVSPTPAYSRQVADGRVTDLDVTRFDAIVLYGCHVDFSRISNRVAILLQNSGNLSHGFRKEIVSDLLGKWWNGLGLIKMIPGLMSVIGARPCLFYPHPLWSEGASSVTDLRLEVEILAEVHDLAQARLQPIGVQMRRQPEMTVIGEIATKQQYSFGSVKLNTQGAEHPATDFVHMNQDYGALVLVDILEALRASSPKFK